MRRQNVKNTIFERILQNIAPHPCCGCGKVGVFLCEECKNDIIYESFLGCVWCRGPICSVFCLKSRSIGNVWIVGERRGVMKRAIDAYKFNRIRYGVYDLAKLLSMRIPRLPLDTIVTSIPTIGSHRRVKGYDHAQLLAKQLASILGLAYAPLLVRVKMGTQHTANRYNRAIQAAGAYAVNPKYEKLDTSVLLIDDIITTGSTIENAVKALKTMAPTVFVAALAYQPLDE